MKKTMKHLLLRMLAFTMALMCLTVPSMAELVRPEIVNRQTDAKAPWPFEENEDLLEIWFPQMINCDAALIHYQDQYILIDCCSKAYAKRLLILLDGLGVTKIDAIYNTHPHHDHLLGFAQIADHVQVGELALGFPADTTKHSTEAVAEAEKRGIPVTYFADGDEITIGPAKIKIYMKGDEDWSLNNRSAMMRLVDGDCSILFAADMEKKALDRAVETIPAEELRSDILKHPHHGLTVLTDAFAQAVAPQLSIITNNTRVTDTTYNLRLRKIPYIYTSSGYTHLVTNGESWFVEVVKAEKMQAAQKAFLKDPSNVAQWIPSNP